MRSRSVSNNDGTALQDILQDSLKQYCELNPSFFYRFPDTKSARGLYLKSTPSDFLWSAFGYVFLVECKSTRAGTPLITMAHHGDVGKRQVAKHRLWHRSGQPSLYLWADLVGERFEWHSGQDVVSKSKSPVLVGSLSSRGGAADLYESLDRLGSVSFSARS